MKVRLNLSTKPLETHRKFLAGAGILGVVAGLFFIGLGLHVYAVRRGDEVFRERVVAVRSEMVNLDRQRAELEQFFSRPENAKLHDRSAFLNTLIDEQSLNWTQMFMDLEKILPAGVRVVSIEQKHDKGVVEVKLTIGATSDEAEAQVFAENPELQRDKQHAKTERPNTRATGGICSAEIAHASASRSEDGCCGSVHYARRATAATSAATSDAAGQYEIFWLRHDSQRHCEARVSQRWQPYLHRGREGRHAAAGKFRVTKIGNANLDFEEITGRRHGSTQLTEEPVTAPASASLSS